ncbi:PKD domain-containing protein [Pseudokineococcus lusitanus]|uniref:PKD repeat protein n=1 Tax=Pseudokineococcus lusitanus TaxID=763993 RepID=A0A3N1HKE3_9ACTN|nr:PKD domain-containing protein [Pseudokineococcus lusitanus]ROP42993.1 PKD repeat protein [Pseudokineococcus lusitanus]
MSTTGHRRRAARWAAVLPLLLVAPLASLPPATAATTTTTTAPAAVSADVLPTVQVDGVVWDTLVVGGTVYDTGKFAQARPAGAAPGTQLTARSNILAFDLATGNLLTTWNASLDGQGLALAASADGSRIFVGGDFATVNGTARARVAALDARTGALVTGFRANANARVRALAVRGDTLYVGGIFTTLAGQARTRLGAVSAVTGALTTWAPTADAEVMALAVPAGTGSVVAAGRFATLNGQTARGSGALEAGGTGASRPWAANATIQNYGADSAIYSLSTSGSQVFGSGYDYYGPSDFENTFAADAATGTLQWVAGCYGDTYDTAPVGGVLYSVGHPHNCSAIGGNPETTPRSFQRAMVTTTAPAADGSTNVGGPFPGRARPDLLAWTPDLASGKVTGQQQAAWTVSATSGYVVLGGEFPTVNGTAQQGLVRFAARASSPRKQGPNGYTELAPTATATAPGTLRLAWRAAFDRDDRVLTYELLRGEKLSTATVVGRRTAPSAWWSRPTLALSDSTAPAGTTQTYRVRVSDPDGNTMVSATTTATAPGSTATPSPYADAVLADGATSLWRLGEASGPTAFDSAGADDLTLPVSAVRGADGAVTGDTATTFAGTAALQGVSTVAQPGPNTFSVESWVRTTSTQGGKLVGFGNSRTAGSTSYDRHVYMTPGGQLVFGVYPGTARTVQSTAAYNDGRWHHVVATLGAGGMQLYVDGTLVGARTDTTAGQAYTGWWHVGGDTLGGWPGRGTPDSLAGTVDEVAVYPTVLTTAQVRAHAAAGGAAAPNDAPVAAATATTSGLSVQLDGTASSDPDGRVASWSWALGDGTTTTGATATHTYAAAGRYTVTLTVTDDRGASTSTTRVVEVTAPANTAPTAALAATTSDLSVQLDGTGSADADGRVVSWTWDLGDGETATGATTSHTYSAAGRYTVTLTVADDAGATATATRTVEVTAPPVAPAVPAGTVAADTFTRSVTGGLGTAEVGGAWTTSGSGSSAAVDGTAGAVTVGAGRAGTARLADVSAGDVSLATTARFPALPTGGGAYVAGTVRAGADGEYRAKVRVLADGSVTLGLTRLDGSTETTLAAATTVAGLTVDPAAGATGLRLRVEAVGSSPTTLRARVWAEGAAEPATWQRTATDATAARQAPGSIGLWTYLSGSSTAPVVVRHDDLSATTATTR